jgi:hypothetical protein
VGVTLATTVPLITATLLSVNKFLVRCVVDSPVATNKIEKA